MQAGYVLADLSVEPPCAATRRISDEALIQSIAEGDKQALSTLFARNRLPVYRFALRLTHDESVANDIVSDVFLDVWREAYGFEARAKVSTWLLAVTRNKAFSVLRRRHEFPWDNDAALAIEDPSDDAETTVGKHKQSAILRKCLTQLSPEHREIIDLVYYHGKSVSDVAQIVGIPKSTVKTRMFYARSQIGRLLKKDGLDRASL